jgi:hypothetical protein
MQDNHYHLLHTKAACIALCWQENTTLIAELSDLKAAHKKISDMESTPGTGSNYTCREHKNKTKVSPIWLVCLSDCDHSSKPLD